MVALYLPYYLWRWSYYGYPLPNTFYVKVGGTWAQVLRGAEYIGQYGLSEPLLGAALVAALAGWWLWRGVPALPWREVLAVQVLVALSVLYVVAVGGDWMPGQRFIVPFIPLLVLLVVWGAAGLARHGRWVALVALVLLVLTGGGMAARLPADSSYAYTDIWSWNYTVRRHREIGRWIRASTPPGTWIATGAVGAIPYYAERPTIDIYGLVDEHIAHLDVPDIGTGRPGHEKSDPAYVVERAPELITYKASDELWDYTGFRSAYTLTEFPGPEGHSVQMYVRNDTSLVELSAPR
ncbi:MAG: hypothetical protein HC876_21295, partial [Chloroflexaceae bacterium]|nr:hypothetical protein [Chloroflexaceae bacterium]